LFLYNLALITHDATKSVNPSIENNKHYEETTELEKWQSGISPEY